VVVVQELFIWSTLKILLFENLAENGKNRLTGKRPGPE